MRFLKYWERNGARRPFPPITEARKQWGERVFYPQPQYVAPKHCRWCGKELSGRRTSFCSNECSRAFNNMTVWNRGRDSYSLRILYRDNFTCQDCGEFNAYKNEHGIYIPIDNGNLNVHHIKFVCNGGGDEPENLITLCKNCHKKRHKRSVSELLGGNNNGTC
jgi:5-methylcytosine-specific restriction protein A|nr:MAG TPA: NinG recombination protein [Caudoviricetes sp.]